MESAYTLKIAPQRIAVVDLMPSDSPYWVVTRVNVPWEYRGKGFGRAVLLEMLYDADQTHTTLVLVPSATGRPGIDPDHDQLAAWYERYGFVETVENRFSTPYPVWVRKPRHVEMYRGKELWNPGERIWIANGERRNRWTSAWGARCCIDELLQP